MTIDILTGVALGIFIMYIININSVNYMIYLIKTWKRIIENDKKSWRNQKDKVCKTEERLFSVLKREWKNQK